MPRKENIERVGRKNASGEAVKNRSKGEPSLIPHTHNLFKLIQSKACCPYTVTPHYYIQKIPDR